MRVLMVTCAYGLTNHPNCPPYVAQQVNFLRRAGVEVDVFCFRGQKRFVNYLRAWQELHINFKFDEYDLVHIQHGQSGLLNLPKKCPTVVTFHGSDLLGLGALSVRSKFGGMILRNISRWVAHFADEVIVVAEHLAQHLPRGIEYHVIPTGVDLELFTPFDKKKARRILGLPPEKTLVLFSGDTNRPVKRFHLAEAVLKSINREINAELVVAQRVAHRDMPYYLNAADLLLLTSIHEGSPTVVKEALACNLPVVSVDVGDIRRLTRIVPGCFLCPDDSVETVAATVLSVINTREDFVSRDSMALLDEKLLTERILGVYRSAVRRRRTMHAGKYWESQQS